jgi:putative transposase
LCAALGEAHRRYSRRVNFRERWRGYLWQGRFASAPMDEAHLLACARYVELNPVRARLTAAAEDWPWSSAWAHLAGQGDGLVDVAPLRRMVINWPAFLARQTEATALEAIRAAERTGRPLGGAGFVAALEQDLGRTLARQKPGPKPKVETVGFGDS